LKLKIKEEVFPSGFVCNFIRVKENLETFHHSFLSFNKMTDGFVIDKNCLLTWSNNNNNNNNNINNNNKDDLNIEQRK